MIATVQAERLLVIFVSTSEHAVAVFALPVLQAQTIPMIVAGNILAAFVMGAYLWRRHPLDLRKLL